MKENTCIFNEGVDCNEPIYCATCGWNPAVEQERKSANAFGNIECECDDCGEHYKTCAVNVEQQEIPGF